MDNGEYLYLAHPFPTRKRMYEWKKKMEDRYAVKIRDPFYDLTRKDVEKIDAGVKRARGQSKREAQILVDRDLTAIGGSKGVIAYIDGSQSVGTLMEMVYAFTIEGLPVYTVVEAIALHQNVDKHPWVTYHSTEVFTGLKDFERWLKIKYKRLSPVNVGN